MNQSMKRLGGILFAGLLALAGCAGSDGKDGAPGQNGTNGLPGDDGQPGADLLPKLAGEVVVSNVTATAPAASGVTVSFNVKVAGINRDDFTTAKGAYYHWEDPTMASTMASGGVVYPVKNEFRRTAPASYTVAANGDGNYTVTLAPPIAPFAAAPTAANARYLVTLGTADGLVATALAKAAGSTRNLISDKACQNCHGAYVFREGHHGQNPTGGSACVVCHTRFDSQSRGMGGDRFYSYVHGIHNSHNMPERADLDPSPANTVLKPAGVYARNDSTNTSNWFSVGFPGFTNNCSTCHDTAEGLALVAAPPVNRSTCFSCHDSFEGFPWTGTAASWKTTHLNLTATANCGQCHDGTTAPATAAEFHNGLKTERSGLLWDGQDQSVVIGKKLKMQITGVSYDPGALTTLAVSWTAAWEPVAPATVATPVNPCNTDVAVGPIFHAGGSANAATGKIAQNLSLLRAYAQGDDWVANLSTTSPGQPNAVNLSTSNTTCVGNVATTRVKAETTTATRGQVALQGKPQVTFDPATATSNQVIQIRAQTPVREFKVADGSLPTAQRRQIVSVDKCNACHLGSLYQHGGNRVDRVELCIMCHNPASNEKQNRVGMGVDINEAYDGKLGQTYDLKTLVHSIHSAGETGVPLVYYRSNGIYLFGNKATLAATTNWPDPTGATTSAIVYGSSPATTRTHNFIEVHYPRALNDCAACHVNDSDKSLPDPTKSMAVTAEDAGSIDADAANVGWRNQLDDVLVGPVAQSCLTCHQSSVGWENVWFQTHAYENGFAPSTTAGGRQDFIDGNVGESCFRCHGAGKVADLAEVHK